MRETPHGWRIFDAERPILIYEYSFGPGVANALAVRGRRGLVVVSPPCGVEPGVFDDLVPYGKIDALVASNAFHYLGLREWKARFPDAAVFAPAQSVARVQKHSKLSGIRPLADAGAVAGDGLELIDMPHYKTGEVLVRITTTRGAVWYVTDIIMNLRALPANPLFNLMFRLSKSGPGLRFNNIAPLFMVDDKTALRRWFTDELRRSPPDWLIATHGDPIEFASNPDARRSLLGAH